MASQPSVHHQGQDQLHGALSFWPSLSLFVYSNTLCFLLVLFFHRFIDKMSRRHGSSPKLELKLNLSPPPRANQQVGSASSVSPTSPPSSCVSSEMEQDDNNSSSPEAKSMVLVGCPRCLMYVMMSEGDTKCPRCKSTVLLDFLHDNNAPLKTRRT